MVLARRIRVAFCIDSFSVGGTELNAVRTAEALSPAIFELLVVHLQDKGPLQARYAALGVRMIHLPISKLYSFATARQGYRLAGVLRRWGADILHTHDLYTNIFAVPWARLLGKCKVLASRRWWYDAPRPGLGTLNRFSYRFANRVLANSPSVAYLLNHDEGVPEDKIVTIPNFLEERAFVRLSVASRLEEHRAWGLPTGAFVVGIVARLAPVKNHAMLLRAVALLGEPFHLVLIGDGATRAELEQLAGSLVIQARTHFLGQILGSANLHAAFDVSVLCSLSEGFPNSIIEAMAAACPVVTTPVGGIADIIEEGQTGLIVPSDSPQLLAAALQTLHDDARFRGRIAAAGQASVRKLFHQDVVIAKLSNLYAQLAGPR